MIPLLASFVLLFVGVSDAVPVCQPIPPTQPVMPALSETFELPVGGVARIAAIDLSIVFQEVESDSRCPTGVSCVWEGEGVVHVCVGPTSGPATSLKLGTRGLASQNAKHAGFVIQLLELRPYPARDASVDASAYRVRLVVSREKLD